jgi:hypothetical protein
MTKTYHSTFERLGKNKKSLIANVAVASVLSLLIVGGTAANIFTNEALAANTLTVQAKSTADGKALNMWMVITQKSNGAIVKSGLTPLTFVGTPGTSYTVTASDYRSIVFDHWSNGSTSRNRTFTISTSDLWFDAFYTTGTTATTTTTTTTTTHNLTVNALSSSGSSLGMYATVTNSAGTVVKTGFTPLTYTGSAGATYSITVSDYGSYTFDHWQDSSTANPMTVTLNSDITGTAYYTSSSSTATTTTTTTTTPAPISTSSSSSTSIQTLIPKTGINVSLYAYPSGTGASEWQKVYDQKVAHPSVPVAITFNPSTGPGSYKDSNFASWISKLQSVGVITIGYTYDSYGTRSLGDINRDADKYRNWYNADGLFIDEVTNMVGFEQHYKDINAYAHSIGMKITIGNPGTDVPQTYMGTLDMFDITEGPDYMPMSWLQYCVLCTPEQGWHQNYDKHNFTYMRYGLSWLDTVFEANSSQYVGLLYLTDGTDSDGRWFHVPSFFATEVATLDR